uniref:Peptidase_M13 domain-containing protein n=1 Tax=Strongyloides papillosus TaxID=174720 RepID=A0A0N5C608_STREA
MIKRIKEEFILLIDERQDTFDELSIDNIFLKFTNMTFSIKSDDFGLTNVTLMEECHKNIGINYNDTIENIVNSIKHQQSITKSDDKMWSCREKIFKPAEYLDFHVYSSAKYHPKYNKIYISSDTLAEPSFSIKFPSALNYGFLGFTIAQAILDAFDTKTINHNYDNFDSEEGKKSVVSEESMNHMIAISTCFTQEWFKQRETINHRDVDNILSADRKIADNAGLKIAYKAYRNFVRSFGEEYIVVSGFEQYTENQLFFIGFGRHFCEYTSEDSYVPHNGKPGDILSEIRTNSILKNYHEFSNTFYCSYKNKLMHTKTCEVW